MILFALGAAALGDAQPLPAPPTPPPMVRLRPSAGAALARQIGGELSEADLSASGVAAGGAVVVRYVIDTGGRAANCTIVSSSFDVELDSATCRIVEERFRFSPARDASGNAVAETRLQRIAWQPPAPPPPPGPPPVVFAPPAPPPPPPSADLQRYLSIAGQRPARLRSGGIHEADYPAASLRAGEQGTVAMRFIVGANGVIDRCTIEASSGFQRLDDSSCMLIMRRFRYYPAQDENGNPVEATVTQRIGWVLPPEPEPEPAPPSR
jgi:TonB family protein